MLSFLIFSDSFFLSLSLHFVCIGLVLSEEQTTLHYNKPERCQISLSNFQKWVPKAAVVSLRLGCEKMYWSSMAVCQSILVLFVVDVLGPDPASSRDSRSTEVIKGGRASASFRAFLPEAH